MRKQQPVLPLADRGNSRYPTDHQSNQRVDPLGVRANGHLKAPHHFILGVFEDGGPSNSTSHQKIDKQSDKEDRREESNEAGLDAQQRPEDTRLANRGEPHLIRPETGERSKRTEQQNDGDEDPNDPDPAPVARDRRRGGRDFIRR